MHSGVFKGVYATVPSASARAGRKRYWFVWDAGELIVVQPLDAAMQPAGERRTIGRAVFEEDFLFQPEILAAPVSEPAVEGGNAGDDPYGSESGQGAAHGSGDVLSSRKVALKPDPEAEALEHDLRAEFAMGLARLRHGDRTGAQRLFSKVAEVVEGVKPVHKHLFTEFGINLRKSKLPETACLHHQRVVELAPHDGNAHFNLARAYYDMGDMETALQHLHISLNLSPGLEPSTRFIDFIELRRGKASVVASGPPTGMVAKGDKQENGL